MKTKPVARYRNPVYPSRLQVLADPDLLKHHLPPAWRAVPQMAGSVALFLAVNSTLQAADKKAAGPTGATAVVAPIFEHGDGRGATGCVVVSPPVFLSEEEAWQVIGEELAAKGVKMTQRNFDLRGVAIPDRMETFEIKNNSVTRKTEEGKGKPYQADAADPKKHVAVEFVSYRDYHRLGGAMSLSTVQSYDFKGVAKSVSEQVAKGAKDKVYFGVLYDPASKSDREVLRKNPPKTQAEWQKYWKDVENTGRGESQRLLRLQVQDFIKWLEGQGVI